MKSWIAALLLGLSLAGCAGSEDGGQPTTPTAPVVTQPATPSQPHPPSTMEGGGVMTPAPSAYQDLCNRYPEACD